MNEKPIQSFVVDEAWGTLPTNKYLEFIESLRNRSQQYKGPLLIASSIINPSIYESNKKEE